MGLSSSKSKTTTDQKTAETGTTTPFNLPGVDQALIGMTERIGAFGETDPYSFVAAPAPLQRQAWEGAATLADWQPQARLAAGTALGVAQSDPARIGAPIGWNASQGKASLFEAPKLGSAPQAEAARVAPTPLGPAALARPSAYTAPKLGEASSYAAPKAGTGALVSARGYSAPSLGEAATFDAPQIKAPQAAASASLLDNLGAYRNPYEVDVIAATMADMDRDAGSVRARLAADAAKAGAFGGSRLGLREAETEGELARARAAALANLRSQGFDRAAELSGQDAERRQASGQFHAAQDLQRALAQAGLDENAVRHAADTANARVFKRADLDQAAGQFNAELGARADALNQQALNESARLNAQLEAQARADGAAARNQFGLRQAELDADASRFNAGTAQEMEALNSGQLNQLIREQAAMAERAAQAEAANRQAAALANMDMLGRYGLAQGELDRSAASQNAQATNAIALANLGHANEAARTNAQTANEFGLANLRSADSQLDRRLQTAGLLGDIANNYGAGVRADLGTMAQLGDQQRAVESQYALAPLAQEQALAELYGITPYGLFSGQNVTANSLMSGTSTTTQKPSLFNSMLQAAATAAKFA